MNVREIVREYLIANGYTGLYRGGLIDEPCGCGLGALFPCDGDGCDECQPAYYITWSTCRLREREGGCPYECVARESAPAATASISGGGEL
jgi:hypothetical protein